MVCSAYSFVLAYAEKETASEFFGIFKLFFCSFFPFFSSFLPSFLSAAAVSTWLKPSPDVELDFSAQGIYSLRAITQTHTERRTCAMTRTHTHTHLWPLIIAEWPLPPLPVEMCHQRRKLCGNIWTDIMFHWLTALWPIVHCQKKLKKKTPKKTLTWLRSPKMQSVRLTHFLIPKRTGSTSPWRRRTPVFLTSKKNSKTDKKKKQFFFLSWQSDPPSLSHNPARLKKARYAFPSPSIRTSDELFTWKGTWVWRAAAEVVKVNAPLHRTKALTQSYLVCEWVFFFFLIIIFILC